MSVYLELEEEYAQSVEEKERFAQEYDEAQEELYAWSSFWELEQFYQAGDLENCAAVLIMLEISGQYTYCTPDAAQERFAEIVQAVVDKGILDEYYKYHPWNYNDLLDTHYPDVLYGLTESGMEVVVSVNKYVSRETEG